VRAHRSSITQTLAFDPRRAALHFRPPVLQRAERAHLAGDRFRLWSDLLPDERYGD
jgi:hypothetical protein